MENLMFEGGIAALGVMLGSGLIGIACLVAWIWALIDILKHDFEGYNKLIWLVLVLALPFLGVILYYFIGRGQRQKSTRFTIIN
jgi:hypothetical protein